MREFGPHGRFKDLTHGARRALFADLVKAINGNKLMSVAGTLTAAQYRQTFKGITKSRRLPDQGRSRQIVIVIDSIRGRSVTTAFDQDTQAQNPDVLRDDVKRFDGLLTRN